MIELALFLLDPGLPAAAMDPAGTPGPVRAPRLCDDGNSPWRAPGVPNWDCEIEGCSPHEPECWDYRLDLCFDDAGDDAGICMWDEPATCHSRWECFKLWANCNGSYKCHHGSWWEPGCTEGSCTAPRVRPEARPRADSADLCSSEPPAMGQRPATARADAQAAVIYGTHLWLDGSNDTVRGQDV